MKPIVLPSDTERHLVSVFDALGNPARMRILAILSRHPESSVSDLVNQLPLAQSTISQHLQVLQDAGLVFSDDAGTRKCCQVDVNAIVSFAQSVIGWTHSLATQTAHGCLAGGAGCKT